MSSISKIKIALIGAGRMGGALLSGWLDQGAQPGNIHVSDPALAKRVSETLAGRGVHVNLPIEAICRAAPEIVVLAIKPQMMAEVLPTLRPLADCRPVFLSIAAGTSVDTIAGQLAADVAIVRAMPNTPAAVHRGISAAYGGPGVAAHQRDLCQSLLGAVGDCVWVEDEGLMAAVTALSGSGPAYVFHLVEAMAAAGEKLGLPEDIAMRLARATVSGAGEMLHAMPDSAEDLRVAVTSPGGTTAAALAVLKDSGALAALMLKAMQAAEKRARELGS